MAHKFSLSFTQGWITRRGPNLIPVGLMFNGKFHPGRQKCYEYVIKDRNSATSENVQIVPIQYRKDQWLYGPATLLSSRQIIYPCSRFKCLVPCPCLICDKKHPRCRAGQSCDCDDCKSHFQNHTSYHSCFHFGCKSCNNIVMTIPFFNFFFLDKQRKTTNKGVYVEEQLQPHFKLPPDLRTDMTSKFLSLRKWPEKLKNWKCGIEDDGIWCMGCSTMFFSIDMLKAHTLAKHNTSKVFRHNCENDDEKPTPTLQCDHCTGTFGSRSELTRHVESVHHKERFECPNCDMTFSRRDNYEVHRVKAHDKAPETCDTCGMKFKTYSNLVRHIEKANCATRKCEICQKTFSRESDLKRHKRETCNLEKVYVVKCDVCETTFIRTSDLVKHKKIRNHPDGSAKFICNICDQKTCNLKLLRAHIKSEHVGNKHCFEAPQSLSACGVNLEEGKVDNSQTYKCEFCGKQFAREDSVLKHKVTHKIIDKLKCELCASEFSLRKNYKRHQIEALGKDGNPRHECYICGKTFCTGKILSAHVNSLHKEEFFCTVCKQIFNFKHHYERHVIRRTPFTCEDCGRHFCNKKGYSEHISAIHLKSLD